MNNTKQELTDTFVEFARIDSPTSEEMNFSNHLNDRLKGIGYQPFQDARGNILVQTQGRGEPLLLAAHMDTVEPGRGIQPRIDGDIIRSDGRTILGADNKASVSMLMMLLKELKENPNPSVRPLDVLFSVSEEGGTSGVTSFDINRMRAKEGLCFDTVKPELPLIILGSPGYEKLEIDIIGEAAHASEIGGKGKSVVRGLGYFLQEVPHGRIDDETIVNVGVISTPDGSTNTQMGKACIKAEVRSFSPDKINAVIREVREVLNQVETNFGLSTKFTTVRENEPYVYDRDDPHIRAIAETMRKVYETNQIEYDRPWSISDANEFYRRGIRAVNVGYGVHDPHTVRECIAISDLEKVMAFTREFVRRTI